MAKKIVVINFPEPEEGSGIIRYAYVECDDPRKVLAILQGTGLGVRGIDLKPSNVVTVELITLTELRLKYTATTDHHMKK